MSEHHIAAVNHISRPSTVPVGWGLDSKMRFSTSVTITVHNCPVRAYWMKESAFCFNKRLRVSKDNYMSMLILYKASCLKNACQMVMKCLKFFKFKFKAKQDIQQEKNGVKSGQNI